MHYSSTSASILILLSSVLCVLRTERSSSLRVFLSPDIYYHATPFLLSLPQSFFVQFSLLLPSPSFSIFIRYLITPFLLLCFFLIHTHVHTQSVHPSACIILLHSLFILILPCRPCSSPPLKETTTRLLAFVSLSCHSRYLLSICIILTISSFAFHDAILGLFLFSLSFYFSLWLKLNNIYYNFI